MYKYYLYCYSCTCCSVWKTRVLVAHTITSMITEQNAHCLLGDLYRRMDVTNQNGLHGLLLVVEMVVRDRPKLLKCICCMEGEECSLVSYLLAQHLCKKELSSRFVANFVGTPTKIFNIFYPLKQFKTP